MSKGAINFSKDNEYYTPKEIVSRFGGFDYDPATTPEKAQDLEIKKFDTKETDGLTKDWTLFDKIWINPPFTYKHLFLNKAIDTFLQKPYIYIYILLPIEFLTTKRFNEAIKRIGGFKLYLPNGRIKFQSGLGKKSTSPAFGSVIIKLQKEYEIELIDL